MTGIRYELSTSTDKDDRLHLSVRSVMGDKVQEISRAILDAQEKAIHDHLVKLGWTPPASTTS